MTTRRDFFTLLGGAGAWPLAARAAGPRPRIAVLSINSEQDERKNIAAFVDGLRALGYVTSQNVDIDYRYAEGDTNNMRRDILFGERPQHSRPGQRRPQSKPRVVVGQAVVALARRGFGFCIIAGSP